LFSFESRVVSIHDPLKLLPQALYLETPNRKPQKKKDTANGANGKSPVQQMRYYTTAIDYPTEI
jgi:hypothetical protein